MATRRFDHSALAASNDTEALIAVFDAAMREMLGEAVDWAGGSRLTVSVDFLEYFAGVGHPHVHGSRSLLCVLVAHLDASIAAVTAAGNRRPASSALRVSAEGTKTTHRAA